MKGPTRILVAAAFVSAIAALLLVARTGPASADHGQSDGQQESSAAHINDATPPDQSPTLPVTLPLESSGDEGASPSPLKTSPTKPASGSLTAEQWRSDYPRNNMPIGMLLKMEPYKLRKFAARNVILNPEDRQIPEPALNRLRDAVQVAASHYQQTSEARRAQQQTEIRDMAASGALLPLSKEFDDKAVAVHTKNLRARGIKDEIISSLKLNAPSLLVGGADMDAYTFHDRRWFGCRIADMPLTAALASYERGSRSTYCVTIIAFFVEQNCLTLTEATEMIDSVEKYFPSKMMSGV